MLLQMQGFFKDMNAICKVLNIGQPVLQTMTVLTFVSRVLKNVLLLVQNDCKKNCKINSHTKHFRQKLS